MNMMLENAIRNLIKEIYEDAHSGVPYTGDYEKEISELAIAIRKEIKHEITTMMRERNL